MAGSLDPRKIMLDLYLTSHRLSVNVTSHPALQSTRMPISDAMVKFGTMCPCRTFGSPGSTMSQMCVDRTTSPFGRLMERGSLAGRTFVMGVPAITKMEVAPVSAMVCDGGTNLSSFWGMAEAAISCWVFDVTTVTLSISLVLMGYKASEKSYLVL